MDVHWNLHEGLFVVGLRLVLVVADLFASMLNARSGGVEMSIRQQTAHSTSAQAERSFLHTPLTLDVERLCHLCPCALQEA